MDFSDTPLSEPLPIDPLEQIQRYARDLAWGILNRWWEGELSLKASNVFPGFSRNTSGNNLLLVGTQGKIGNFAQYYPQWNWDPPSHNLLLLLGYLTVYPIQRNSATFTVTQKAFDLLSQPEEPPSVFISYRREVSSALGLLIVARMKAVGAHDVFIDMNIQPGAEWHAQLEERVRKCRRFVLLVGRTTLESEYVQKEIAWAIDTLGLIIIPVLHDRMTEADLPAELSSRQVIRVESESAEHYELAMIKLLNAFGYVP